MPLHISDFSFSFCSDVRAFQLRIKGLVLDRGELVFLHGRSGCGKSTLMNVLAGVLKSDLEAQCRAFFSDIAYVMHESTLLPWMSIGRNLQTEERLRDRAADGSLFLDLCKKMGLPDDVADIRPRQLSLGMRQRVEIAKAISFRPGLLLLDESLSGIDAEKKQTVVDLIISTARDKGTTVLGTAHQLTDLLMLAERVYVIEDGLVKEHYPIPEDLNTRAKMPIADLLSLSSAALLNTP